MRKLVSVRAAALATALLAAASQAHAQAAQSQVTLADPQGSSAVLSGVLWLQGTLMGNVATAVAVMAVAAVGFMMLTGRMNWRYGATVILGCFILFGATTIVSGIRTAAGA
ncbi:type VI secretion protein [Caulobacter sp. D4A]|uniref:TrbC/VirB2 family protein n=1 Tax=unclassified Caulobacter TaxID=2648921 RepID=UPI000D733255|nr:MULTISPECIES: TrbC/VirB2 family protein [unclassified Caulobacter]PXA75141.1 type VI secretion protein [Caulobacter sp. D4A]PXA93157.1 type VI secretion protein [Caulobacter sp. D5]